MGKLEESRAKSNRALDEKSKVHKHKNCRHRHNHGSKVTTVESVKTENSETEVEPAPVEGSESSRLALLKLLEHFLHQLQKKDVDGVYAHPVDAASCPGYYQMIKEPMDFSTIRVKLKANKYATLDMFKSDFERICSNACSYNTIDSEPYKFAEEMSAFGQALMSPDKIRSMIVMSPFIRQISKAELGFDVRADEGDIDDASKDENLLEEAKVAARGAAEKLRVYKPENSSKLVGFKRHSDDGSTSLGFLIGGSGVIAGTDQRPISLGSLIGRVKQGTGSLQGYREDRRNLAKAVYPLYYGAYSSHGPCFDSTFATLTKEETDLICSTYFKESNSASPVVEAIIKGTSKVCDYSTFIGHHLLDALTNNEHSATTNYSEDERMLIDEEERLLRRGDKKPSKEVIPDESASAEETVDFESLKSLADDGIDVSFLETLQKAYSGGNLSELDNTASLIGELHQAQLERLSAPPPAHFAQMAQPGDHEMDLANQIQTNLVSMTKQVTPDDVVPRDSLRKALGMSIKSSCSE